jgi:hypothetical protein
MDSWSGFLQGLGKAVLWLAGASGVGGVAIQIFKRFSEKWLDAKFARRLEELKHAHATELEDLRFQIATLLDRATKLHAREFDVLPEAWSRQARQFSAFLQSYPDLERVSDPEREAFLSKCRLREWERAEVREAKDKNQKYQELIFKHDLAAAKEKFRDASSYVLRSGIFIEKGIRARFQAVLDLAWNALVETEVNHEIEHGYRQREARQALSSNGENMMKVLEAEIHERLWPVAKVGDSEDLVNETPQGT